MGRLSRIESGFDFRHQPVGAGYRVTDLNSPTGWARSCCQGDDLPEKIIVRSRPEADCRVAECCAAGMKLGLVQEGWRAPGSVAADQFKLSGCVVHYDADLVRRRQFPSFSPLRLAPGVARHF